jgi:hypothetical protein
VNVFILILVTALETSILINLPFFYPAYLQNEKIDVVSTLGTGMNFPFFPLYKSTDMSRGKKTTIIVIIVPPHIALILLQAASHGGPHGEEQPRRAVATTCLQTQ